MKATEKQKRFADYYVESGNAEQAAIKAGYSKRYARCHAHCLRYSPNIKDYIEERLEQLASERIASASEVLEYLTSVLRGESSSEVVVVEGCGDGCSSARRIYKSPDENQRLEAAKALGKRYGLFTDKVSVDGVVPIMFVGEDSLED